MTVTEEQAIDIFMYIASTLKCNDIKLSNGFLMMKDIDTNLWFSGYLECDNGRYFFTSPVDNYVSMLDKIIEFEYLVVNDRKYKIPRSLEELLIEMDLNR